MHACLKWGILCKNLKIIPYTSAKYSTHYSLMMHDASWLEIHERCCIRMYTLRFLINKKAFSLSSSQRLWKIASLVPRPLPDFITQQWKKNLGVAWEGHYVQDSQSYTCCSCWLVYKHTDKLLRAMWTLDLQVQSSHGTWHARCNTVRHNGDIVLFHAIKLSSYNSHSHFMLNVFTYPDMAYSATRM